MLVTRFFPKKREDYHHDHLSLTQQLLDEFDSEWTSNDIDQRQQWLANLAPIIWPFEDMTNTTILEHLPLIATVGSIEDLPDARDEPLICETCSKKLNRSVYSPSEHIIGEIQYKSCPRCSKLHGTQHVFHIARHPDPEQSEFGFAEGRINSKNIDGIQAFCKSCRDANAGNFLPPNPLTCQQLSGRNDQDL